MIKKIKNFIRENSILRLVLIPFYRAVKSILKIPKEIKLYFNTKKILEDSRNDLPKIFYIGIPAHTNLGDLAQGVCIRKWLKKHYSDRKIVEIETNALVNTRFSLLKLLREIYNEKDYIVFQSGYTTTDLGGFADEMHCAVIKALPNAKFLMMPQTIFFVSEERKNNTSKVYNSASNMLYLARDSVSFDMAKDMFPDIAVREYPDIVTTLIGNRSYENQRNGILFCCREDCEKYYSDDEITALMQKCSSICEVKKTDTTKSGNVSQIVSNAEKLINDEIEEYSKYDLIITDRYHGTILSLVAGTPIIIIKTTDHKVTTGADWFKGIYDEYVYVAKDLDEAYCLAKEILSKDLSHKLEPYFEREYYDKLPELFEGIG